MPEGDNATLGECSLVNLIQGTSLDFRGYRELQKSVVGGHRVGHEGGRGNNLGQNHFEDEREENGRLIPRTTDIQLAWLDRPSDEPDRELIFKTLLTT